MPQRTTPQTIGIERATSLLATLGFEKQAAIGLPELIKLGVLGGRSKLYELIADGTLPAVKMGSRVIFLVPDLIAVIAALPVIKPKHPKVSPSGGGVKPSGSARRVASRQTATLPS